LICGQLFFDVRHDRCGVEPTFVDVGPSQPWNDINNDNLNKKNESPRQHKPLKHKKGKEKIDKINKEKSEKEST